MFLKLCLPQVLLFVFYINCTSVAIQFSISYRSGYFASLSRVCTNLSQVVFARSLYRHFFSQIHHSSTFLHATSFFHLFPSKTRSNMGRDGEEVRELSERRFEPRENIWKARTAQSSFVSASFERAAKIVCEICNFFSPGSSCNFAEINNLCAAWNNDDGVKHSFSISSALGCVSFEPVLTLWDWLLGET